MLLQKKFWFELPDENRLDSKLDKESQAESFLTYALSCEAEFLFFKLRKFLSRRFNASTPGTEIFQHLISVLFPTLIMDRWHHACRMAQKRISPSRVAQWKRAGPVTQRSVDRNHDLLVKRSSF
ncbi:hypothetical protein CDAR_25611 [Caerostris darwini]|uniref:Maturase K n=1 Tax=Caerostris darwini TaxID=1538125 RepID=A0AAV4UQP6_9ARAC|nr:hypothetical protein CDAR_25611 [Caerostris darwini]